MTSAGSSSIDVANGAQLTLWGEHLLGEDPDYLSKQLITYIGNKRALLGQIGVAVTRVKERLGKDRLRILDAFSGSGVVSRYLKSHAAFLASNDIEDFAAAMARCYLRNKSTVNTRMLRDIVRDLNASVDAEPFETGFIEEMYAPRCEHDIRAEDRVFYTRHNARRLDNYRRLLDTLSDDCKQMLLGPLLGKASIHANTSGVFKGFYKDRHSKIGQFGGSNADALTRIMGDIVLEPPVLSRFECDIEVLQEDANEVVTRVPDLDLVYLDPPYNQHPYGSNYFMLNLLVHYQRPVHVSRVSGIPADWRRSDYNVRSRAAIRLRELVTAVDAKFILVSFNNEGFIRPEEMRCMLSAIGELEVVEVRYNTFRGSRNLRNRNIHVTEQLFLVERH